MFTIRTPQIATGIVDASRHLLDKPTLVRCAKNNQVDHEFSNLIEIMKLKKLD
jgi:succinoglycan biosynthesis transport protein ExoP